MSGKLRIARFESARTVVAVCLAVFALGVLPVPASAMVAQFQEDVSPVATYQTIVLDIRSSAAERDKNRENAGTLLIGRVATGGTDDVRALLGFDLSSLPAGATISSVSLTLFGRAADTSSANEDFGIHLHALVGSIVEGSPGVNGPSWNSRDIAGPTAWTVPGGDYDASVLSSTTGNPTLVTLGAPFVFSSTPAFVTAAQVALDGSGTLYLLARSDSEVVAKRGLFRMGSDETPEGTQYSPLLTIEYVPDPSSLALIALGITMRRRRRTGARNTR